MSQTMQAPKNTAAMVPKQTAPVVSPAKQTLAQIFGSLIDGEGYRKRFDELLGKRSPQFVSSMVSLVNGSPELQKVAAQSPITIIQAGLKAAAFDLPIDPSLGYAYIMPFNNNVKLPSGEWEKRYEAAFVLGYKGMIQLALRTGAYRKINVIDVREGELIKYDRLTEDIELAFVEDESKRDALPVIGWVGYYRLTNGAEKTILMTRKQVETHERKNRKGMNMTKGWRDDFDSMAAKTVLRRLIGKWGLMSIEYQRTDEHTIDAATAAADGMYDGPGVIDGDLDVPAEDAPTEA